jgi:hypothetical protein
MSTAADSTLGNVTRARTLELALLAVVLVAQGFLFTRTIHAATNYDEGVYLAAVDALRHGQALGSNVFAAQFPGFYDLLRGLSYIAGIGVVNLRAALLGVMGLGTIGGWLVGRRVGGAAGGLLVASFLTIAPPLDLFSSQVIADTPALALMLLAAGLATLTAPVAAVAAGVVLAAALSVKLTAVTVVPVVVWFLRGRIRLAVGGFAGATVLLLAPHVGALRQLWASDVTYHEKARSTPAVIPHPDRQIFDQIPHGTPFFWLALAAAVAALVLLVLRRPLHVWPLWTWVVLGVVALLLQQPLHYNHLVVFPYSLAVAAAATIGAGIQRASGRTRLGLEGALALLVAAAFVQQIHRVDIARAPEPAANVAAARALAQLTPSNALVVADQPIIAFLAHRRVVGRLVDTAFLRFETGSLTDATVIRDLRNADAVVVSRALRSRPAVLAYVKRHYQQVYDAGGVEISVRRR